MANTNHGEISQKRGIRSGKSQILMRKFEAILVCDIRLSACVWIDQGLVLRLSSSVALDKFGFLLIQLGEFQPGVIVDAQKLIGFGVDCRACWPSG